MAFGGDTANVAIYCARAGVPTHYMTALGQDTYSHDMRAFFEVEGVSTDLILEHSERVPGLYAIQNDENGERSFTYWRERSAARALFDVQGADEAVLDASNASILYLSGITLSLFEEEQRRRVIDLVAAVRANGGEVAFDGNFRARGWGSGSEARIAFRDIAPYCSIVLPTFEDEVALHGECTHRDALERWHGAGARVVALKLGSQGVLLSVQGNLPQNVTPERVLRPVDTTGAGDSFNAAFLCSIMRGETPQEAAVAGNRLAGEVIMHRGAIIPREEIAA